MKLRALIVLVMTAIIIRMVFSLGNAIPLAKYDVIYDATTIAEGTPI